MAQLEDSGQRQIVISSAQLWVAVLTLVLAMFSSVWAAGASMEARFGKVELTQAETRLRIQHLEADVATNASHLESFHHSY